MNNICLIGFMGSGKSTIGKILAEKLKIPFIDQDEEIEKNEKRKISEIFEKAGEDYFREIESRSLLQALSEKPVVVALGGGVIEREDNRKVLQKDCTVVYLTASIQTIISRIESEIEKRPKISKTDTAKDINALLLGRLKHYESVSNITIKTDNMTPEEIADNIIKKLALGN